MFVQRRLVKTPLMCELAVPGHLPVIRLVLTVSMKSSVQPTGAKSDMASSHMA